MIRHTPSFIISIIIHLLLLVAFFYTYRYVASFHSEKNDEKLCLKITCFVEKHKEHVEEKPKPKKIIPPKSKPKPKLEKPKQELVKKIVPKPLTVPVIQEIVEPEKELEPIYIEPIVEEVIMEVLPVESQEEKAGSQEQQYMDEHIKKIVRLLSENLYYPRSARKRGVVGEVIVKFTLAKDAEVSSIEIVSSQSDILSRAARKTIEDLSGDFPRPPNELTLQVPIEYELKR